MTKIAMNSGAATAFLSLAFAMANAPVSAQNQTGTTSMNMPMMATGLVLPRMDPVQGRALFASKGCVVCHSINAVGGTDAPMLDAELMTLPMNPFEFAARMWRGAGPMVDMQRTELGGQIELNGDELAAIIAFVHDANEQKKFSEKDIPENIKAIMNKKK